MKDNNSEDMNSKPSNAKELKDSNIVELPKQVVSLVNVGSKENGVPGEGHCLIGTTALYTAGDVETTVEVARNVNTHLAIY